MEFDSFPQRHWSVFRSLAQSAERIDAKRESVLDLLIKRTTADTLLGADCFEIERSHTFGGVANVKTSIGNARVRLSWDVSSEILLGLMVFERECHDKYDLKFWEAIFALKFPEYEHPYSGGNENRCSIPINGWGEALPNAIFGVIMSVLGGVACGPLVSSA